MLVKMSSSMGRPYLPQEEGFGQTAYNQRLRLHMEASGMSETLGRGLDELEQ